MAERGFRPQEKSVGGRAHTDGMTNGVVKFFKAEKGWGAISSPELPAGRDAWVHFSVIEGTGYRVLAAGDLVDFDYEQARQDNFDFRATRARRLADGTRFTERLRLEPVGPDSAADLWLVHNDDEVSRWYDDGRPTPELARVRAESMAESWRRHGVHKWMAYDRTSGEVVGRGGLSRTPVDDDWGQLYSFLPAEPWVRAAHESRQPGVVHAHWLEIGWALRQQFWGHGYASEIGRAGLAFAFEVLGMEAVVSCTVRHNSRSRAVMERIGMRYAGEIRSRGLVAGSEQVQDDAPFAVCVVLRGEWEQGKWAK